MKLEVPPGPSPPSSSGLPGSTITLAASKPHLFPNPEQTSQAPNGLLKEKDRGSSCGTLAPQSGQASFCEYNFSAPFTTATVTSPSASLVAVVIEASSRFSISGLINSRSTTTSMVWFLRLSSVISSSSDRSTPSTRARTNPCRASFSSSFLYSPLRPRTMGARIITRSCVRIAITCSRICSVV